MIYLPAELCGCSECGEEYGETVQTLSGTVCVMLVSSGEARCEEIERPLLAGSLILYTGTAALHLEKGAHIVFAALSGAAADKAAQGLLRIVVSDCGACPMAAEILSLLLAEISPLQRARLSFELLCELSQANEKAVPLSPLVAEAINEMHKSYASIFGVEELSQSMGVSKSHLVRVFSQSMGMPPGQYLTRVRIDAAKLLLSQRNYQLELIATLCGFSGANYLCKVFKRETGLTPAAYRKKALEKPPASALLSDFESSLYV